MNRILALISLCVFPRIFSSASLAVSLSLYLPLKSVCFFIVFPFHIFSLSVSLCVCFVPCGRPHGIISDEPNWPLFSGILNQLSVWHILTQNKCVILSAHSIITSIPGLPWIQLSIYTKHFLLSC